jgi:serine phosphatase RsbU (regulator of sigma subunit)
MIVSLIELSKRKVTIARAGHPYPILIKKEKEFKILETTGSIIHPKFFIEPELKSFSLSEGDTIYFYSDGLFDLNLFKNKNRANELEICEFFNKINHLNLNDIIKIIYENYKEEPHKIQIDDISLIIFRYKKELINLLKQKWDFKNNL